MVTKDDFSSEKHKPVLVEEVAHSTPSSPQQVRSETTKVASFPQIPEGPFIVAVPDASIKSSIQNPSEHLDEDDFEGVIGFYQKKQTRKHLQFVGKLHDYSEGALETDPEESEGRGKEQSEGQGMELESEEVHETKLQEYAAGEKKSAAEEGAEMVQEYTVQEIIV